MSNYTQDQIINFANNLKSYRKQLGLSQKSLSELIKQKYNKIISIKTISDYESMKKSTIKDEDIKLFCSLFNINSQQLFTNNENNTNIDNNHNNTLVVKQDLLDIILKIINRRYPIDTETKLHNLISEIKYYAADVKPANKLDKLLSDIMDKLPETLFVDLTSELSNNTDYSHVSDKPQTVDDFSKVFSTDEVIDNDQIIQNIRHDAKTTAILFMELKHNGLNDSQAVSVLARMLENM